MEWKISDIKPFPAIIRPFFKVRVRTKEEAQSQVAENWLFLNSPEMELPCLPEKKWFALGAAAHLVDLKVKARESVGIECPSCATFHVIGPDFTNLAWAILGRPL